MVTADPKPKPVATDHWGALDRALIVPTTGTKLACRGSPAAGVGDRGSTCAFSRTGRGALALGRIGARCDGAEQQRRWGRVREAYRAYGGGVFAQPARGEEGRIVVVGCAMVLRARRAREGGRYVEAIRSGGRQN